MNDLKGIIEDCNKSDLVSEKVIKKIIEIIGQEEWQILHDENNDVCTTMGELIITLKGIAELEGQVTRAFEVLEGKRKRIEELEEKNEKMRDCLKRWYEQNSEKFTETFYEKLIRDTEMYLWNEGVEG